MVGGGDFMPALDAQSREGESCPPTLKLPISVPQSSHLPDGHISFHSTAWPQGGCGVAGPPLLTVMSNGCSWPGFEL